MDMAKGHDYPLLDEACDLTTQIGRYSIRKNFEFMSFGILTGVYRDVAMLEGLAKPRRRWCGSYSQLSRCRAHFEENNNQEIGPLSTESVLANARPLNPPFEPEPGTTRLVHVSAHWGSYGVWQGGAAARCEFWGLVFVDGGSRWMPGPGFGSRDEMAV